MNDDIIMKKKFLSCALLAGLLYGCSLSDTKSFHTEYFQIDVNSKGYIVGMWNRTKENRNFSPADQPSPLLALYDEEVRRYYYPQKASYSDGKYRLEYENGSVATVSLEEKDKYIKLKLESLEPRNGIDDVQWGNYYTNISNILGEIIGVARDTSAAVNYAIGVLALDDNTIGGESRYTSETGPSGYIAHSPDPVNHPLPITLQEGQQFTMGGDGINDVAFYNRKESYFRILYGTAAFVDASGRINIRYHSRDRRKGKMIYSPEGNPIFQNNEPNHMMRQDVPGVDFIGSSIALWGSPDSIALMDVIQTIVKEEGLPYPTFNGKWIKDPTTFMPDLFITGSPYDSVASYAKQMGVRVIHSYNQPFLQPDRSNGGFIDGRNEEKNPFHFTTGDLSHREYAELLKKDSLILGRTSISNSLAPGTKDCSPVPSDSICILHRRFLTADLNESDTLVYIDNPAHLEEVACWEGHSPELNMVKIGKELIHYMGVSREKPYRLLKVTRGYWNTTPTAHVKGDAVDKLQPAVGGAYTGLIPNLELQDEIAKHYADICKNSGLGYYDFDGQEFFFHTGFGAYSVKRFFRHMFARAKELGIPDIRFTGATLSEGSWHYQSIWNVGGGLNMYDAEKRLWGSTTSQGKDLRDVTFANFFPSSFGHNFSVSAHTTLEQFEHIEATAIGYNATYSLNLNPKDVETCPDKYAIFNAINTWEEARRADAFPASIKKLLQNPSLSWRLEKNSDKKGWILYQMENGQKGRSFELYPGQGKM